MPAPDEVRLDRSVFETGSSSERRSDRAYWMSKTADERFEALELLRQIAYGYDPATERLQRVFEVARREQG